MHNQSLVCLDQKHARRASRIEKREGDVWAYRISEATVDRGTRHGLREGYVVYFVDERFLAASGTVIEVAEQTSRVRIRALHVETRPTVPEVGWRWSTRWKRER